MNLKNSVARTGLIVLAAFAWQPPALAGGGPDISATLKKMLGGLPIDGIKTQVEGMVGALKQTDCGGGLKGCYATQSGPLHLYFFKSSQAQQTFLLVIDKTVAMPHLLGDKVQKVMGQTSLGSPIISISTTDFDLVTANMPPSLQQVVHDHYFNVGDLAFSSGVQIAAEASLGGLIKTTFESFGVRTDGLTMRAAVVMPIPTDLAGGAGSGAGLADSIAHGETMKKAGTKAALPEAFVEFQFPPGAVLNLRVPTLTLTDATFFLDNTLKFGYKGNAYFPGDDKKILLEFQTPLNPEAVMDFADFSFLMATPPSFTMMDSAIITADLVSPEARLAVYGGGFIRNIAGNKKSLTDAASTLSVFALRNPYPAPEYKFGDPTRPFPADPRVFNIAVLGPTAQGGPMMTGAAILTVLGQPMGSMFETVDLHGIKEQAIEDVNLKLGPLGHVKVPKMVATASVGPAGRDISLRGSFGDQTVEVIMDNALVTISVPATCYNPFEIKTTVGLTPTLNIADVFESQGGASVDPSHLVNCTGPALQAALHKIDNDYRSLGGYSAAGAIAAYDNAKNIARDAAGKLNNTASQSFNDVGNAFKHIGKKRHKSTPERRTAAEVFDWDYYYDTYPDLQVPGLDLATHWLNSGWNEGRQGSAVFNANFYYNRYLDVQQLCSGQSAALLCAMNHWLDFGIAQGRQGSASFSVTSYMKRYLPQIPGVAAGDYAGGLQDFLTVGADAGRDGSPDASVPTGQVSGPVIAGTAASAPWDDNEWCSGTVSEFKIAYGKEVYGLQLRYGNSDWSPPRGGMGKSPTDVLLAPGEAIVSVDYRSGDRINQLTFHTNLGNTYGPYGGGGGTPNTYHVTPSRVLGCLAGNTSSGNVNQLIFSSQGWR